MTKERSTARKLYREVGKKCQVIAEFSRNLNLHYLDRKLDPCYHRDNELQTIQKTLLRKNKSNILLTGAAGCGKTAIAEGLAAIITERRLQYIKACDKAISEHRQALDEWAASGSVGNSPAYIPPKKPLLCDCVIYDLSLNSMVSGTKYRGEFEARIQAVIDACRCNPDVILFIDEFHAACCVGATEGTPGAGQILKPALARGDIRVIAATTTEEKVEILNDKALARRFCELEVSELRADAALETARGILKHYCSHHQISTKISVEYLLSQVRYHLPDSVFPDNFINVVDETLAGAVFDGLSVVDARHFNETLSRMTGHIILNEDECGTLRAS